MKLGCVLGLQPSIRGFRKQNPDLLWICISKTYIHPHNAMYVYLSLFSCLLSGLVIFAVVVFTIWHVIYFWFCFCFFLCPVAYFRIRRWTGVEPDQFHVHYWANWCGRFPSNSWVGRYWISGKFMESAFFFILRELMILVSFFLSLHKVCNSLFCVIKVTKYCDKPNSRYVINWNEGVLYILGEFLPKNAPHQN